MDIPALNNQTVYPTRMRWCARRMTHKGISVLLTLTRRSNGGERALWRDGDSVDGRDANWLASIVGDKGGVALLKRTCRKRACCW
ncbi:hypothetical protein KCP69_24210 [Salmonella enterica subsp. enterica]|nr:hypothetical protein KCP69_24210 [Salmonella enterica subsp. enterica]